MFNISEHTKTTYPVAQPKLVTAYPDTTGASGHYFMADSSIPSYSTNPPPVHCPDGNTIISNRKIKLNLPHIPPEAKIPLKMEIYSRLVPYVIITAKQPS